MPAHPTLLPWGLGIAFAGIGAVITAAVVKRGDVSATEARRLVEEHNRRERRRLHLPGNGQDDVEPPPEEEEGSLPPPPRPSIAIVPLLSPAGAGASLTLSF